MTLHIYMKSGNIITCNWVKDWKLRYQGNEILALSIKYRWFAKPKLIIASLALDQIEAIVKG